MMLLRRERAKLCQKMSSKLSKNNKYKKNSLSNHSQLAVTIPL